MTAQTLLLFGLTVFPLVCTPGPDILFVASQGLTGGRGAVWRANAGILSGYCVHALLAAFGIAALITAWPPLFHAIRWAGLAYLLYLAVQMFRSAMQPGALALQGAATQRLFVRGFVTSPTSSSRARRWRCRRCCCRPSSSAAVRWCTA